MNVSKIVRTSLAMSMCLGLLAACGDRGQFRSKKWTAAEIEANMAAKLAKQSKDAALAQNDPAQTPVTPMPTDTSVDPKGSNAPAPKHSENNPASPTDTKPADGAKSGRSAGSIVIDEILADREKFIKQNLEMMQALDPMAVNVFLAVTPSVTPALNTESSVQVALDAAIVLGGGPRYVIVEPKTVSFSEKDTRVSKLGYVVRKNADGDGETMNVSEQELLILAACKDATCSELHLSISAGVDTGKATLALVMKRVSKGGEFVVADSNLKAQRKDFQPWLEERNKREKKVEKVDTQVTGQDGKSGAGAAPKADGQGRGDSSVEKNKGDVLKTGQAANPAEKPAEKPADKPAEKPAEKPVEKPAASSVPALKLETQQPAKTDGKPLAQAFKPQQQTQSAQPTGTAVVDLKPEIKPIDNLKAPDAFKFDSAPATKGPSLFNATKNLTGKAITDAEAQAAARAAGEAALIDNRTPEQKQRDADIDALTPSEL